jgi:hypothetical protein
MNRLSFPKIYRISMLDGGADTFLLGKGWDALSAHTSRRENLVILNHETPIK